MAISARAPAMGAQGQINVPSPMEAPESDGLMAEGGDDRPSVPVGPVNVYGPVSPPHGAAGGYDVDFGSVATTGSNP